jgi:hypothetical protein
MTKKGKRDRRIKTVKQVHQCSVCDREAVEVCGDVCDKCASRGVTRRFQDRERIDTTIYEWLEGGKTHQKGGG